MFEVPHFEYPFRFGADGHAATVEQDSAEDIVSCATVVLKVPVGSLLDLPAFGAPEQLFQENGIRTDIALSALNHWEPRAAYEMTTAEIAQLAQTANVNVNARPDA